ncbi:MAG: hypothetical protein GY790_03720 [Bacteroidetes bacterium]|nr:hypothetical protein [Bacteroidota bacterium]
MNRRIKNEYSKTARVKQIQLKFGLIVSLLVITGISSNLSAQIYRMGAGLCFASGFQYNSTEMGNPGLKVKTWIALDPKSTIHIVPTITAFNRNILDAGNFSLTNYMFMGDLDGQYMVLKEGTLKIVVFAGGNLTYLNSVVAQTDPKYPIPDYAPDNENVFAVGGNLGAGLELRMGSRWDMNISTKYILSKYSQFIISVEGVYYFKSRRRAYRR